MPPTEAPTPSVVPTQTGSGDTVKAGAVKVGFFDNGIPPQLYSLWRTQVHRGIQNWDCFGAAEAGTNKWTDFVNGLQGSREWPLEGRLGTVGRRSSGMSAP